MSPMFRALACCVGCTKTCMYPVLDYLPIASDPNKKLLETDYCAVPGWQGSICLQMTVLVWY